MREILFRGKFGDKWKYGYLTIAPQSLAIKEPYAYDTTTIWCVAPETVGQYTGLKDKNGTKIFEGDICKFESYIEEFTNYEILWRVNMWVALAWEENIADVLDLFFCERSIIIGNIHDNPELLEE